MSDISRRKALGYMAAAPMVGALDATHAIERAMNAAQRALAREAATGQQFQPRFFNAQEWRTVRVLVDLVIPADERSGSATEAGVPEFMDFMLMERTNMQGRMRSGLEWLDAESRRRFQQPFADAQRAQQAAILDDIAFPDRAPESMEEGVRFFNSFRDLTASGFWSSETGIRDLRYMGNTVVTDWQGCPEPALRKLGVSYQDDR